MSASRAAARALAASFTTLAAASAVAAASPALAPPPPALSPSEFRALRVARVEQLTPDTRRVTLALPTASTELGGSVASCVVVRAPNAGPGGADVVRPYTPTSAAHARGEVELIVKTYKSGQGS